MVTNSIKTQGMEFLTTKTKSQTNSTKLDFADTMKKAESDYETTSERTDDAKDDVSDDKTQDNNTVTEKKEDTTKADNLNETKNDSKDSDKDKKEDFEKVGEALLGVMNPTQEVSQEELEKMQKLLEMIAGQLDVSMEELQASMDSQDFTLTDLQDSQNLLKLITDVKDLNSAAELLTNPELLKDFKTLNTEIQSFMEQSQTAADTAPMTAVDTEGLMQESDMEQETNHETEAQPQPQQTSFQNQNIGLATNQNITEMNDRIQELLAERMDEATSKSITDQVINQIKVTMKNDVTSLQMQLYPEHLGKVSVQVVAKNGVLTAQIAAENETAKMALESQLALLKESFEQQGLKVESVEVMVASKGFDQNTESGSDASSEGQNSGKRGKRNLFEHLEETDATDGENDLKEALGNTVSYTA